MVMERSEPTLALATKAWAARTAGWLPSKPSASAAMRSVRMASILRCISSMVRPLVSSRASNPLLRAQGKATIWRGPSLVSTR